jgi:hypothetical protein
VNKSRNNKNNVEIIAASIQRKKNSEAFKINCYGQRFFIFILSIYPAPKFIKRHTTSEMKPVYNIL